MTDDYNFKWSELAFGNKSAIKNLDGVFIVASRQISVDRFKQLVKTYLPGGNLIVGIANEEYIKGFENQPHFKTLNKDSLDSIIKKVNSTAKNKIYTIEYSQSDTKYLLEKLNFKKAIFINGSWKFAFHTLQTYYVLVNNKIPYELVSPFASDEEARIFESNLAPLLTTEINLPPSGSVHDEAEMLKIANKARQYSYDYNFQTGLSIGRVKKKGEYELLTTAYNKIVPYETYAMHNGASREVNFSPPNDLNHYDTIHAEVELLIKANQQGLSLKDATVFLNLMPCPPCSRMLCDTDIKEVVYSEDHSSGYAITILEASGKKVKRLVADLNPKESV